MKKPARSKRAKSIKITVRVLRESALKAFETKCSVTHISK